MRTRAFTFDRGAAVAQIDELTDRTEAATPFAGPTGTLAQLIAGDPERQVAFDILYRVVSRIGVEGVDGIHSVEPRAPSIATLEDLHMDPVLALSHTREGNYFEISDPGGHLAGNRLRQCLHHRVSELVARAKARDRRRRKYRVGERAERCCDLDRTQQPVIHRDMTTRGGIEQHRAHRQPYRVVDGTLERHVDRPIGDLVGSAG